MIKNFLILGIVYAVGVTTGYLYMDNLFSEYKIDALNKENELLSQIQKQNIKFHDKLNDVEKNRIDSLEELKDEYETIIVNLRNDVNRLSERSRSCDATKTKTNNSSELICYTRGELAKKLEGTMTIGAKCDKIAIDYNNLLKIINAYNSYYGDNDD